MSEENVSLPVAQALASALEKIEAYVPTEYVDNSEPDIDAKHLNHAEQGIMRVTNLLNAAVDVIQGQESRLADAETKIGTAVLTGGMTDLSSGVNSLYSNIEYGTSKIGVVSNKQSINKTVSFLKQHANSPRAVVLSIHTYGYFYGVAIINSYNNSEFSFTLTPIEIGNGNGQWNVHWIALW